MKRWRLARKVVQVAALAFFLTPLLGAKFVSGTMASSTVFGLVLSDPLAALQVLAGTRDLAGNLAVSALIVLVVYAVLRRAFCAWACPVNLILEPLESLRVRLKLKDRVTQAPDLKYWILGGILALSAALALPVYEMVSPVSILMRNLLFGFGPEIGALATIIILDILVARRFWCRSLCPLGAFYSLTGKLSPLAPRITSGCTGCASCREACPMGEWILDEVVSRRGGPVRSGECSLCGECLDECPRNAIGITFGPGRNQTEVEVRTGAG